MIRLNSKIHLFCFILLASITIGSVFGVEQYLPAGEDLLDHRGWEIINPGNQVAVIGDSYLFLSSQIPDTHVRIEQSLDVPGDDLIVKLSADIRTVDVARGNQAWNTARLLLLQYNAGGQWLQGDHGVISLEGSHGWRNYEKTFKIQPEAAQLKVAAALSRCKGGLNVRNIRLYPVSVSRPYTWTRVVVLGGWGLFFIFFMGAFVAGYGAAMRMSIVLCMAAILFTTMIPGSMKQAIYSQFYTCLGLIGFAGLENSGASIGRAGHFIFFAAFGGVMGWRMPGVSIRHLGIAVVMLAGGTELAQIYIDGRTPILTDFVVDMCGGVTGLALANWKKMKTPI